MTTLIKDDALAVIDNVGTVTAAPVSADIFADLSPEIYKALNPILLTETLDCCPFEERWFFEVFAGDSAA